VETIEETEGVKYDFEPRLVLLYIFGVTDSRACLLSRSDEWSANTLTILLRGTAVPSARRARDRVPVELP
jgi:hypothetical protein